MGGRLNRSLEKEEGNKSEMKGLKKRRRNEMRRNQLNEQRERRERE